MYALEELVAEGGARSRPDASRRCDLAVTGQKPDLTKQLEVRFAGPRSCPERWLAPGPTFSDVLGLCPFLSKRLPATNFRENSTPDLQAVASSFSSGRPGRPLLAIAAH